MLSLTRSKIDFSTICGDENIKWMIQIAHVIKHTSIFWWLMRVIFFGPPRPIHHPFTSMLNITHKAISNQLRIDIGSGTSRFWIWSRIFESAVGSVRVEFRSGTAWIRAKSLQVELDRWNSSTDHLTIELVFTLLARGIDVGCVYIYIYQLDF